MKLGEVLKEKGLITEDRIQLALAHQKVTGTLLGETFIKLGFVSSIEIAKALAEKSGMPFIDLSEYTVSEDAIKLIPKDVAEKTGFIPLRLENDFIEIGVTDPSNIHAIDTVSKLTGKQPRVYMIDNIGFYETLERAYFFLENPIQLNIDTAINDIKSSASVPAQTIADLSQHLMVV